jgi:hypothetical protein
MGSNEGALFLSSRGSNPLKADWQTHVLVSSGYLELGMLDDAALALEEIAPEEKTRSEVLGGARCHLPRRREVGHGCGRRKSPRESRA